MPDLYAGEWNQGAGDWYPAGDAQDADQATTTAKRHFCITCQRETEHEREATLPPQYKSGDPDYEDRSKCGVCGETYQCQTCGAPWDVGREACSSTLDHGGHGPESDLLSNG